MLAQFEVTVRNSAIQFLLFGFSLLILIALNAYVVKLCTGFPV